MKTVNLTPEEAFDLYAVHGAVAQDFAAYVGQDISWLAEQIADMDPDNPDPVQTAKLFMAYVESELQREA